MTIYSLTAIKRIHEGRTILDIDRLDIEEGKIHALLGPNGAGKSTLLNILGFVDHPTSGTLSFRSKPVQFQEQVLHQLRQKVVLVNQNPILFTTTVYKNIEFGLKIRRIKSRQMAMIIDEALDLVGMRDFVQARADKLSGGEAQRVVLARALALSPDVLLCDEPTSNVDQENQSAVINILKQINEVKKITLLVATHDRLHATSLAHDILYLSRGRPAKMADNNLFTAEVVEREKEGSLCTVQNRFDLPLTFEGSGRVRLAMDPKKISIGDEVPDGEETTSGRVVQLTQDRESIRIVIDVGVLLTIILNSQRYQALKPMVGDPMMVRVPPEAISVRDDESPSL